MFAWEKSEGNEPLIFPFLNESELRAGAIIGLSKLPAQKDRKNVALIGRQQSMYSVPTAYNGLARFAYE